jgi:uncharacterized membrane protein
MLLFLIPIKPLWLDEIIQLEGTCRQSGRDLLHFILTNPGATPLGYWPQHLLISFSGCDIWSARLLSALCGAGAFGLMMVICKQLQVGTPIMWLLALYWIVCPIILRYSLEGRPYMQAMFFAMAAISASIQFVKTKKHFGLTYLLCCCFSLFIHSLSPSLLPLAFHFALCCKTTAYERR